MRDSG